MQLFNHLVDILLHIDEVVYSATLITSGVNGVVQDIEIIIMHL